MIGRVRRGLAQITRLLDRAQRAREGGKIPYLVEDSMGRRSVRTLAPGEPVPPGWQEMPTNC